MIDAVIYFIGSSGAGGWVSGIEIDRCCGLDVMFTIDDMMGAGIF